jgi:uncharacterized protein YukE
MRILGGLGGLAVGGAIGAAGKGEGKASVTAKGFIGVDTRGAREYVKDICGVAIKAAIKAAKDTKVLFNKFEDGWEGQSLAIFKENFAKAVLRLEKSLAKAFATLVKQITAVTDAMVDQDINMVQRQD